MVRFQQGFDILYDHLCPKTCTNHCANSVKGSILPRNCKFKLFLQAHPWPKYSLRFHSAVSLMSSFCMLAKVNFCFSKNSFSWNDWKFYLDQVSRCDSCLPLQQAVKKEFQIPTEQERKNLQARYQILVAMTFHKPQVSKQTLSSTLLEIFSQKNIFAI